MNTDHIPESFKQLVDQRAAEEIDIEQIKNSEYHLRGKDSGRFYWQAGTRSAAQRMRDWIYDRWERPARRQYA